MAVSEEQRRVEVLSEGAVAYLRLNRPTRMNAIDDQLRRELLQAVKQVQSDQAVGCVVLTGAGAAFSAGADVKELSQQVNGASPEDLAAAVGRMLRGEYVDLITRLRTMPKPVIAAINGVAAGIGASIAMAADIRVAVPGASFVEAFVGIGLAPDGGVSWLLPRFVGPGKALEMFFTGQPLSAQDAERFGLVNHVVPADELQAFVADLARRLAGGSRGAIAAAKRAVNRAFECSLEEAMEFESYLQELQAVSPDFKEGVTAFIEKREPRFQA